MAHLLQGLILAALSWAAASGEEFSHALHLKLQPDCLACHPQAAASTRREDNLLPQQQSCRPCHESRAIRQQPTVTRLSRFDHAFHLKLGNPAPAFLGAVRSGAYLADPAPGVAALETKNACAACHRGIPLSTHSGGEATKTAHFPHMADCLVCHNKIDPPFSCETCHTKGELTLKPASHTPDYLDSHSRKFVKTGCAVCHGRKFTCLGCH